LAVKLPVKVRKQLQKSGLPTSGAIPFVPKLGTNRTGDPIILKAPVLHGPKKGKRGYVDDGGRIWIKDRAHAGNPGHWDVQEQGGREYFKVDLNGNCLP
jgi:hypothetical protein